jgi:hypothetical protein
VEEINDKNNQKMRKLEAGITWMDRIIADMAIKRCMAKAIRV